MNLAHLSLARVGNHRKVPRVLTNEERVQAYRAVAPVELANSVFNYGGGGVGSRHASEIRRGNPALVATTALVRGAEDSAESQQIKPRQVGALPASTLTPARSPLPLSSGLSPVAGVAGTYDPDPPTQEEVAEAARFKFGAL